MTRLKLLLYVILLWDIVAVVVIITVAKKAMGAYTATRVARGDGRLLGQGCVGHHGQVDDLWHLVLHGLHPLLVNHGVGDVKGQEGGPVFFVLLVVKLFLQLAVVVVKPSPADPLIVGKGVHGDCDGVVAKDEVGNCVDVEGVGIRKIGKDELAADETGGCSVDDRFQAYPIGGPAEGLEEEQDLVKVGEGADNIHVGNGCCESKQELKASG
jgi:hypothetical protein